MVPSGPVKVRARAALAACCMPSAGKKASAAAMAAAGVTWVRWKWRIVEVGIGLRWSGGSGGAGGLRGAGALAGDFLPPVHALELLGRVAAELDGDRPVAGRDVLEPAVVRAELGAGLERVPGARAV